MNYHHSYHAGSFADVFKHSILTLILQHIVKKPAPFCYVETHAGAGFYDLSSDQALKTQEADAGVRQLLAFQGAFPYALEGYLKHVKEALSMDHYPGSPDFVAMLARPEDRLILNEFHAGTFQALKAHFERDQRVAMHQRDAYEFLPAVLPPKHATRGLILIDPPFEKRDEAQSMTRVLRQALKKFRQGIYGLWYPITDKQPIFRVDPDLSDVLQGFEVCMPVLYVRQPGPEPVGLIGTAMVIVNPPFGLQASLGLLLPFFADVLGVAGEGSWAVLSEVSS